MLFVKLAAVFVVCAPTVTAIHRQASVPWLAAPVLDVRAPVPKLLATRTQVEARDITVAARQATCPPQPLPSGRCACSTQSLCSGYCVDESTDPNNCGECGAECFSNEVCIGGNCQCSPGTNECFPGICTNLQTDPDNCGACSNECFGVKDTCKRGSCQCPTAGQVSCPAGVTPFCCSTTFKGTPESALTAGVNGTLASRTVVDVSPATVSEATRVAKLNGVVFREDALGGLNCVPLPTNRCLAPGDCTGAPLCCTETFNNGVLVFTCTQSA